LAPQAFPQLPQFSGSLPVSVQVPLHRLGRSAGQAQLPPAQVRPSEQRWPQAPQFWASLCKLTQTPPQTDSPAAQVVAHCPFAQL
jgi:hypothetical protein